MINNLMNRSESPKGEILKIEKISNHNIYNCSRPFKIGNQLFILARIENIKTFTSQIGLFVVENNILKRIDWQIYPPDLELEDPFITFINDEIIFGAVQVLDKASDNEWTIKTIFYKGKDIFNLEKFAEGPSMMKDIRLVDLHNGKIGVFTRPKGGQFLNGRICYVEINDLEELNLYQTYDNAKLINLPISDKEWVGANDIYYFGDKKLGVLGHLARFDDNINLIYSAISFNFNPNEFSVDNFKIIARRRDFPYGNTKNDKTKDVVFPGGLVFQNDDVYLYCGLSDAEIGRIRINNPFE